ncbi:MAG TPA: exodeoxyribonuclease VII large subunit [Spirochaetota bacterium]|jgi:exodeoxyribonuclease VII large subunit|nr:exodeoxyribonuclease VII large subunit [Spirochaetota bacterium]HPX90977.1 exodeoxyribonuclease VII large subunit [Spirochaetota bacterium]HRS63736.1 exodeoxyribonuclease VII large subunit [Spirochaetota bacterium]HRU66385.1 exodeoxyribonuclease VII large subunit [Spirochaetota bacterium]
METNNSFLSVTELNKLIKKEVETSPYLNNIYVKGEIYNLTYHSSGHIYFSLKDDDSTISATFFRYANKGLKFKLEEGMSVIAFGNITVFEKRGTYQFNVMALRLDGIGELQKRIEQLKIKLGSEGIFDSNKKKPLPFLPKRIGIVTSPTGAAVRDILKVSLRRFPNLEIIIAPAKVQGDDAAMSIVKAIEELNNPKYQIDVIIAGRGGGSFEDLFVFNEEEVVRAFANSRVPIISAVGHEIDHPLCDHAADAAASTPSAAAEIAVPVKKELLDEVDYISNKILTTLINNINKEKTRLNNIESRKIFKNPEEIINYRELLLNDLEKQMLMHINKKISSQRQRLLSIANISHLEKKIITDLKHKFQLKIQKINNLSPMSVMARGFAVVLDKNNNIIKSKKNLKLGQSLDIKFVDGKISADITKIYEDI